LINRGIQLTVGPTDFSFRDASTLKTGNRNKANVPPAGTGKCSVNVGVSKN
jgi:hypothetical protein